MFPAEYEVRVWNNIEGKMEKRHGVTLAKSYVKAMSNIEEYYSDDLDEVKITLLDECSVYEFENTQSTYSHGMYEIEKFSKW